jgi:hypothetical protein
MPPKQPSNGWTPVDESAPATSSNGWTPVDDQQQPDQGGAASRFLTRFTGLPVHDIVQHPGAYLNPFSKEYQQKGMEEHPPAPTQNPGESLPDYASRTAGPVSVPIPGQQTIQDVKSGNYAGAAGSIARGVAAVAPLFGGAEEGQPSIGNRAVRTAGKVVKGVVEDVPVVRQAGKIAQYWKETAPQKASAPASAPETVSPSRTMPGQNAPEVINPPQPKPAAIPQRGTLALPPAPKGAELAELPATGAKPSSQTGEGLGGVKRGQIAAKFKDPGAPLPENSPQARLPEAFQPAPKKASAPAGTTDNPFKAPASPEPETPAQPEIKRGSLPKMMNDLETGVRKGLGGSPSPLETPKAPIYQRGSLSSMMKEGSPDMPEGHTPVQSSAMRSKMYDPAAKEFHARLTSGDTTYVYGDVAPEEAQAFEGAKSKGQAFQAIKQNHPLVAKIVNGKRIAVKATQ